MNLQRYQFAPGDAIEGTLILRLKKPVEAYGLEVRLIGTRTISTMTGTQRSTRRERVFDFPLPLDGEKEYAASQDLTYPFSLQIPQDLESHQQMPNDALGTALKGLQMLSGQRSRIDWRLDGRLKAKGWDVSKKVKITIS